MPQRVHLEAVPAGCSAEYANRHWSLCRQLESEVDTGVPRKTIVSSLPRRRNPSKIKALDSRLRGNDGFFEVPTEKTEPPKQKKPAPLEGGF
jgi:hypothetical protein